MVFLPLTRCRLAVIGIAVCIATAFGCTLAPDSSPSAEGKKPLASAEREEPLASAERNLTLWPEIRPANPETPAERARLDVLLGGMSLEHKVGQMMQAEIQSITPEQVREYGIGSILNGGGSMPNRIPRANASQWVELADAFYEASMDTRDGRPAIPIMWGTDAVHGHNNVHGATLFPHNIGLGAANHPELVRQIGKATAREVRATGIEWVFAPSIAVAQDDRWGRTYESYSEDPQLVKRYAQAIIEGLQGRLDSANFLSQRRVGATAKHFLADGGTVDGDDQGDARIGEQELVQIHSPGYQAALEADVLSIMASFSSWNGEKLHGSHYLLTQVLKQRMGFDGFVVGDWNGHGQVPGCANDACAQSINAGVDMIMVPTDWKAMYHNTLAQVRAGEISEARVDDAVRRILRAKLRLGLFDAKPSERWGAGDQSLIGHPAHRAVARQAVRESLVLLKNNKPSNNKRSNEGRLLPLHPRQHILVAGDGADNIGKQSGGWSVTWQGTGTSAADFRGATSIYDGLRAAVESVGGQVTLAEDGRFTKRPDVAIVVFGEDPYAEGVGDLDSLEFEPVDKSTLALLKSLRAQNIPVVAVFLSGRPMWVNPEMNASDAFVAAWLPGSEGAGVADVLLADAQGRPRHDFRGRLSFSWPRYPLQARLNPHHPDYDPLFPLGYGLSYAQQGTDLAALPEQVPGLATSAPTDIDFYVGRPLQPWKVFGKNHQRDQMLSGAYAALPDGDVVIRTLDKDVQEDALQLTWRDSQSAGFTIAGGALDLSPHKAQGALVLDLKVNDLAAQVTLDFHCGADCKRSLDLTEIARERQGRGWQPLAVPLRCLTEATDDLSAVTMPFGLSASGAGELAFANVRFVLQAPADARCP